MENGFEIPNYSAFVLEELCAELQHFDLCLAVLLHGHKLLFLLPRNTGFLHGLGRGSTSLVLVIHHLRSKLFGRHSL
jgi:hypothetical protein